MGSEQRVGLSVTGPDTPVGVSGVGGGGSASPASVNEMLEGYGWQSPVAATAHPSPPSRKPSASSPSVPARASVDANWYLPPTKRTPSTSSVGGTRIPSGSPQPSSPLASTPPGSGFVGVLPGHRSSADFAPPSRRSTDVASQSPRASLDVDRPSTSTNGLAAHSSLATSSIPGSRPRSPSPARSSWLAPAPVPPPLPPPTHDPEKCPHLDMFRDGAIPADEEGVVRGEGWAACVMCGEEVAQVAEMIASNRLLATQLHQSRAQLSAHLSQCEPAATQLRAKVAEMERSMKERMAELHATRRDLQIMGEKLIDEIEKRAELQHSKESVQEELEQLTSQLFEEANGLVAAEKRQRHMAERHHRYLEDELKSTRSRLDAEAAQLQELRKKFEEVMGERDAIAEERAAGWDRTPGEESAHGFDRSPRGSVAGEGKCTSGLLEGVAKDVTGTGRTRVSDARRSAELIPPSRPSDVGGTSDEDTDVNPDSWMDPTLVSEFAEFVAVLPTVKFHRVNALQFMRTAVEDDVEPCLRFGGAPKVSVRRIADAVVANTLFVQERPAGAATGDALGSQAAQQPAEQAGVPLSIAQAAVGAAGYGPRTTPATPAQSKTVWERLAGLPGVGPPDLCQACGVASPRGYPWRFEFRITDLDPWSALCGRCRDRMVAVGDFYNFVRYVHQGLYARRPVVETFREQARLRRNMFYARIGALDLVAADKSFGKVRQRDATRDRDRDGRVGRSGSGAKSSVAGGERSKALGLSGLGTAQQAESAAERTPAASAVPSPPAGKEVLE